LPAGGSSLGLSVSGAPKKTYPLTSLRFFAALVVVFHHSAPSFLPAFHGVNARDVQQGLLTRVLFSFTFSVSFFYLLSGYVLSLVYLRAEKAIDKASFWAARFARLYPLYLLMIALCTPALLIRSVKEPGLAGGLVKTGGVVAGYLAMLQGWYPGRLLIMNAPSWSLSGEVFFYLCFPVFGVWLWRLRGAWLWMTALGLYVGGQAAVWMIRPHVSANTALMWPPLHLSTLALGVLLARWQTLREDRRGNIAEDIRQVNLVLWLSVGGILLSVLLLPDFHVKEPYGNGLLAPLLAGVIWSLSSSSTRLGRWLCAEWLIGLGNASYALYLIHVPLLLVCLYLHWTSPALYSAYLGLCIGLSLLSFHCFETPVRLWLMERFQRSLQPSVAASNVVHVG
jgi:peptidoglycan/LPS O-acetylase OafA/YrhL